MEPIITPSFSDRPHSTRCPGSCPNPGANRKAKGPFAPTLPGMRNTVARRPRGGYASIAAEPIAAQYSRERAGRKLPGCEGVGALRATGKCIGRSDCFSSLCWRAWDARRHSHRGRGGCSEMGPLAVLQREAGNRLRCPSAIGGVRFLLWGEPGRGLARGAAREVSEPTRDWAREAGGCALIH